eukprot:gene3324-6578_t
MKGRIFNVTFCCITVIVIQNNFNQVQSSFFKSNILNSWNKITVSSSAAILTSFGLYVQPSLSEVTPSITSKVDLDVSINRKPAERISIGLYGNEAPIATKIFLSVCSGEYQEGVSYDYSQISRVQKDKLIEIGKFALGSAQKQETWMDSVGKVRIRNRDKAEKAIHNDANDLKHDSPGVVSVPKGGKSFLFTIAPNANTNLDEDNLVIGKVLTGQEVIEKINNVPVSREDILGTKKGFSSAGKGFDLRAKLASVDRPLQKVVITHCNVEESAAIASFLKF